MSLLIQPGLSKLDAFDRRPDPRPAMRRLYLSSTCVALILLAPARAPDPRTAAATTAATIDFAKAREHWSFRPLGDPPVPPIRNPKSEIRNPVDSFVIAKPQAADSGLAPPADKRTLIRRVTFDLIGL